MNKLRVAFNRKLERLTCIDLSSLLASWDLALACLTAIARGFEDSSRFLRSLSVSKIASFTCGNSFYTIEFSNYLFNLDRKENLASHRFCGSLLGPCQSFPVIQERPIFFRLGPKCIVSFVKNMVLLILLFLSR